MKKLSSRKGIRAFTVLELVIVIAVIVVLAAALLPTGPWQWRKPPVTNQRCLSNLRQVDLGYMLWFNDNTKSTNQFPWEVSTLNNGTMELISSGHAFPHFRTISNFVRDDPKIMVCPSDKFRTVATNFDAFSDRNLSYFVNLNASLKTPSTSIVAGDRHLQANGMPVKPGLFLLTTNMDVRWTRELHDKAKGIVGNIVFADGHAATLREDLNRIVGAQSIATSQLAVP